MKQTFTSERDAEPQRHGGTVVGARRAVPTVKSVPGINIQGVGACAYPRELPLGKTKKQTNSGSQSVGRASLPADPAKRRVIFRFDSENVQHYLVK